MVPSPKKPDGPEPTVGNVVAKRIVHVGPPAVVAASDSMSDACDTLIKAEQTAAAVPRPAANDEDEEKVWVLTENDLLRAYTEAEDVAAVRSRPVSEWIEADQVVMGRAMRVRSIPESLPLAEAAKRMIKNAQIGGDVACHHLVVTGPDGQHTGILSSLDFARALVPGRVYGALGERPVKLHSPKKPSPKKEEAPKVRPDPWTWAQLLQYPHVSGMRGGFIMMPPAAEDDDEEEDEEVTVGEVMKDVMTEVQKCTLSDTLRDAGRKLMDSKQNCLLVLDDGVQGVITPRDILRAFSEGVTNRTRIGPWLQGLQQDMEARKVRRTLPLEGAATAMTEQNLHHLIVIDCWTKFSGGEEEEVQLVVGILSSLDLAYAIAPRASGLQRRAGAVSAEKLQRLIPR